MTKLIAALMLVALVCGCIGQTASSDNPNPGWIPPNSSDYTNCCGDSFACDVLVYNEPMVILHSPEECQAFCANITYGGWEYNSSTDQLMRTTSTNSTPTPTGRYLCGCHACDPSFKEKGIEQCYVYPTSDPSYVACLMTNGSRLTTYRNGTIVRK